MSGKVSKGRRAAYHILTRLHEQDTKLDELLEEFAGEQGVEEKERGYLRELVYGLVRNLRRVDYYLDHFLSRRLHHTPRPVRQLMRIAAYELMCMDSTPDYAAVSQAVEAVREEVGEELTSLVNAALRRLARNHAKVKLPRREVAPLKYLEVNYSHPRWLVRYLTRTFGSEVTEKFLAFNNAEAPVDLRVQEARVSKDELRQQLREQGLSVEETEFSPVCLRLKNFPQLKKNELFQQGLFYVQDEAAQMVSYFVTPQAGELIIDYCAAPGGKATQLAALTVEKARIIACDITREKVARIEDNIERLGVSSVTPQLLSPSLLDEFKGKADRVLVDAPCTGWGTLRRNPDIRWKQTKFSCRRMAKVQHSIVQQAVQLLRPGGMLIYSTCTLSLEENQNVVEWLLRRFPFLKLVQDVQDLPSFLQPLVHEQGFLMIYPWERGIDGTFAARLQRS